MTSLLEGVKAFAALSSGGAVVMLLLGVALWELVWPEHQTRLPFARRWIANFSLLALSIVLTALLAPGLAFLTDAILERSPLRWAPGTVGFWTHFALAFLVLDFLNYALHRTFHAVPIFWRVHSAHHSDTSLDVSTTVRSHPVEVILSAVMLGVGGALLGCSALEVGVYGLVKTAVQLVGHADVRLYPLLESTIGRLIVTPKFHRIHHSSARPETDSNYGEVFAFWDSLLGSYGGRAGAKRGEIEFGLKEFRDRRSQRIDQLLLQPLRVKRATAATVGHT